MKLRNRIVYKVKKYCILTSSSDFQTSMNVRRSQESVQMVFASIRLAASAVSAPLDSATMTCSWSVKVIWSDIIFYLVHISIIILKERGTFKLHIFQTRGQVVSFLSCRGQIHKRFCDVFVFNTYAYALNTVCHFFVSSNPRLLNAFILLWF